MLDIKEENISSLAGMAQEVDYAVYLAFLYASAQSASNTPGNSSTKSPGYANEGPGSSFKSVDDIVSNPQSLYGKSKADVSNILGEGWTEKTYGSAGTGWEFYKGDQRITYHPGGGRHGGSYWSYSSGATGRIKLVGPDYIPSVGEKSTIINMK